MLFGGTIQLFSIISNLKYMYTDVYVQIVIPLLLNTFILLLLNVERISHLKQNNSKIEFLFFYFWDGMSGDKVKELKRKQSQTL